MSHFLIKGTIVSIGMSQDGKRTEMVLQEQIKDKTQEVKISKFGSLNLVVGQRVEVIGKIRSWKSQAGYLNTSLEAEEVYMAGQAPEGAVYNAPQPPLPMTQQTAVADNDIPF